MRISDLALADADFRSVTSSLQLAVTSMEASTFEPMATTTVSHSEMPADSRAFALVASHWTAQVTFLMALCTSALLRSISRTSIPVSAKASARERPNLPAPMIPTLFI